MQIPYVKKYQVQNFLNLPTLKLALFNSTFEEKIHYSGFPPWIEKVLPLPSEEE